MVMVMVEMKLLAQLAQRRAPLQDHKLWQRQALQFRLRLALFTCEHQNFVGPFQNLTISRWRQGVQLLRPLKHQRLLLRRCQDHKLWQRQALQFRLRLALFTCEHQNFVGPFQNLTISRWRQGVQLLRPLRHQRLLLRLVRR